MSTILVVDDNPVFRKTIAAVLKQNGYNVVCAADGLEALTAVRSNNPDLVLLDMAMPSMDGLSCLRALRANSRSGDIPVIVVSAVANRDTVIRAGQLRVDGYMLKSQFSVDEMLQRLRRLLDPSGNSPPAPPLSAATVKPAGTSLASKSASASDASAAPPAAVVAPAPASGRAAPVRRSAAETMERLRNVVQPSAMPAVLREVTALCGNTHSTMNDIADAVRKDPALTMRVLHVANSNFYGSAKQARDLGEAARRIGTSGMRNIAMAAATVEHFADATPAGLVPQRFWEHSLACAMLSELLAQAIDRPDREQLFLAGLLHDIGRLMLSTVFPAEYEQVAHALAGGATAEIVERATFGITHAEATRELMQIWNLPVALIEAGSLHELPVERIQRSVRDPKPALIVALANRLAHALALGDSGNPVLLEVQEHARAVGVPRNALRSVAQQTVERTEITTLFYASRSREEFREPLAAELRRAAGCEVRLALLGDRDPCPAIEWLCERLGWIDATHPQLAVMALRTPADLPALARELEALDSAVGRRLPVVLVAPHQPPQLPTDVSEARQTASLALPARYATIIETITRIAPKD
ncbi:MAG TPA: response regulator [Phycisphaerae bacterium]